MKFENLPLDDRIRIMEWRQRQGESKFLKNSPLFRAKSYPKYRKEMTKILNAKNEFIEGSAIYELKNGMWILKNCSKELSFLVGKTTAEAKLELLKRGFDYNWI